MPKKQFLDTKFQAGLNKDLSPIMVSDKELVQADNVEIMDRGGFKKRIGTTVINDTSYGAQVNQLIEWPRDDGTTELLAIIGNDLCSIDIENNGTKTILKTLNNTRIPHFFLHDTFYFIDQGNDIFEYDGDTIKKVRPYIYLQNISGTFEVGETITGGTSGATAKIDVIDGNNLGVTDVVDEFELNETITGGTSGATGDIEAKDEGVVPTNDLEPIKRCKYAYWHSKSMRIFFAGDSQNKAAVYYSEYNQPEFVKATSKIFPTRADGPVIGLSVLMDALIVGYNYSNWIWRGIDPASDAIWEKLPTSHGPLNNESFTITTNSLSMLSSGGIFAMSPSIIGVSMNAEAGGDYITNIAKNRVMSIVDSITNPEEVRTVFDSDTGKYLIAYCDDGTGINNKILSFDWELKAFSQYKDISINDFCKRENGDLLAATENYILILDKNKSEDYNSTIIDMNVKTSKYNFGIPFRDKKISRIFLLFKNYGTDHDIDVNLYADDDLVHQFTASGDDTGEEIITYREKTTRVGNNFQIEIINNQYSPVEIYGIGFYWEPVTTGGVKV